MSIENECIFCKIASGQIKAKVVHESEQVVAFRDVNPQAPTHILIIPKKHFDRLSSVPKKELNIIAEIHEAAQNLVIDENLDNGFRLVTNNGTDAGQSVQHLHYHLLGGRPLSWPPG